MATGRITTLLTARGFGFITPDVPQLTDRELRFHEAAVLRHRFDALHVRQRVRYDVEQDQRDPRRLRAINIQPL
jgi:cold shock CspA family protein